MRLGAHAVGGLLCIAGQASAAPANDLPEAPRATALDLAAAMMTNDWSTVADHVPRANIVQDRKAPLLEPASETDLERIGTYLASCRLATVVGADWGSGEIEAALESNRLAPPATIQLGWLCPRFLIAQAVVSEARGEWTIRFGKSQPTPGEISGARARRRNADLVEGFAAGGLVEPEFSLERAPGTESAREGEPSDDDLSAIALAYLAAILEHRTGDGLPGMDYLNFAAMNWRDRDSRRFTATSFAQVSERLRECRPVEGWPRRYDRNGERVLAFSSGWRCLGPSGPYANTLFLEIRDGMVAGGRLIENDGGDAPMTIPAAVAPRSD